MQKLQLSNGFELPILGYGVYQIDDLSECKHGVASALDDGYRYSRLLWQRESSRGCSE